MRSLIILNFAAFFAFATAFASEEFDHYFLCKPDIPWEEDPLRENPKDRERLFFIYENQLKELNLPYSILFGNIDQRQKRMEEVLDNFSLL